MTTADRGLEAAERITAGGTPYQSETLGGPFQPGPAGLYLYAPPLAAAMVPLAALPEATVTVGWLLFRVGLLALAWPISPTYTGWPTSRSAPARR